MVNEYKMIIASLTGVPKQNMQFSEAEGQIININILNNSMVMWTSNNYLRIFDLSRREYKQVGVTRKFEDSKGSLG